MEASLIPTPTTGENSVYIHLPFCKKKCDYCHFYVLPDKESDKIRLHDALKKEIALISLPPKLKSLYFGGGTPALYGPERIAELVKLLPPAEEVTLEANPDGVGEALIRRYQEAGINRVSLGIQTFDLKQLVTLGRTHTASQAEAAVHKIKAAGIDNISIDLMYDLPGQTLEDWEATLKRAAALPITHLSLYNLTIEPGTVFFKIRNELEKSIPDPETSLAFYHLAQKILEEAGLMQYEISAFAKPGYYSKHNTGYWLARPFYGLGPSAFSYLEGRRYRNIAHLKRYAEALDRGELPIDFEEKLDPEAHERELFLIALRLLQGAEIPSFHKELIPLAQAGLITVTDRVRLTPRGITLYDSIAAEIV